MRPETLLGPGVGPESGLEMQPGGRAGPGEADLLLFQAQLQANLRTTWACRGRREAQAGPRGAHRPETIWGLQMPSEGRS